MNLFDVLNKISKGEYFIIFFLLQLYVMKYFSSIFYLGFISGVINCICLEIILAWKFFFYKLMNKNKKSRSIIEFGKIF